MLSQPTTTFRLVLPVIAGLFVVEVRGDDGDVLVLSGGGMRGGQVIGATDPSGTEVDDRPVEVKDLFCTIFQALQIDPHRENMSNVGRPIKLVDGGTPVAEAFG